MSIVDSERGLLATALAEYPLHRKREDPEYRDAIARRSDARTGERYA